MGPMDTGSLRKDGAEGTMAATGKGTSTASAICGFQFTYV